ncbi:hypothetical protein Tco_0028292 [Tanacetum coccineum]
MHIRNDPSFFLTNKTGAPQGEELGLIKLLSDSSFSYSDNSFISEGKSQAIGTSSSHFFSSIPQSQLSQLHDPSGHRDVMSKTLNSLYCEHLPGN